MGCRALLLLWPYWLRFHCSSRRNVMSLLTECCQPSKRRMHVGHVTRHSELAIHVTRSSLAFRYKASDGEHHRKRNIPLQYMQNETSNSHTCAHTNKTTLDLQAALEIERGRGWWCPACCCCSSVRGRQPILRGSSIQDDNWIDFYNRPFVYGNAMNCTGVRSTLWRGMTPVAMFIPYRSKVRVYNAVHACALHWCRRSPFTFVT